MDEDIAIINQNTRVSLIKKFFKENSKKILSFIFIIIALLLIYFAYDDIDKDANDKNDPDGDVFNPKGKTHGFFIVFIDLGWSTFKDDKLEEKNYDNDFQS